MNYTHGLFTFILTVLIAGCSSPAGEHDGSLQSYDDIVIIPGEKLLDPPRYEDFDEFDGTNKYKDEVDKYDESLKSYARYVERAHKALVTKDELWQSAKEELSDVVKPNCTDKYFTMPKLPPYPEPPTTTSDMSTGEIAILMTDYSEELNHYISRAEAKVRDSIDAYNDACNNSR